MRTTTTSVLSALTIIVIGCGGGSPSTTVDEVAALAGSPSSVGDEAGAGGEIIPAAVGGAAGNPAVVPPEGGTKEGEAGAAGGAATGGAVEPPPTGGALGGLGSGGAGAEPHQTGGEAGSAGAGGVASGGAGGAAGPDCLWQEAVRVFPPYRFTWQDWEYVDEGAGECSRCEGPICSELELSFSGPINESRPLFDVNIVQNSHFYMVTGCGEVTNTCEPYYGTTRLEWSLVWSGTAWMAEVDRDRLGGVGIQCRWLDEVESVMVDIPGYDDMELDLGLELADWIETIEWRCP